MVAKEQNPINGESQAALPVANLDLEFNRIQRNRNHVRKSRMRKLEYIARLERLEKTLEAEITCLHSQIKAYIHMKQSLQIEHATLKLRMATYEKQRVLQEVAIEKNKEELNRLWELKQQEKFQAQFQMEQ